MDISNLVTQPQAVPGLALASWVMILVLIWSLVWKGFALWKAARLGSRWWFGILLVVNTVGILEIIYLFLVSKKCKCGQENCDCNKQENPKTTPQV